MEQMNAATAEALELRFFFDKTGKRLHNDGRCFVVKCSYKFEVGKVGGKFETISKGSGKN